MCVYGCVCVWGGTPLSKGPTLGIASGLTKLDILPLDYFISVFLN